jgi:hypothetical protein
MSTYLSYGADSDRFGIEFLKYVFEALAEHLFNDALGMPHRMWLAIRVQFP